MFSMQPIGYVRSPYRDTGEIPKGLGAKHDAEGVLEIAPEFEPGLEDIEGFSHLYVIWAFDRAEGLKLVVHPPSDNRPHGVFATRSPRRPNPIALTVVELLRRDGANLHVRGVDMLDRSPILDIKPYLSNVPAERLRRGWLAESEARTAVNDFARRYTAAWCSRIPESVAAFFSLSGSLQVNDAAPAVGRSAIAEVARSFMTAFPDMVVQMDSLDVQPGRAVYHWTLTGANTGPGGTGRRVRINGFEEWRMGPDDLIAQSLGHFDAVEYERQLAGGAPAVITPYPIT